MISSPTRQQVDKPWKVVGQARQVALFVGVAFLAGTAIAAAIDLYSSVFWDSPALQAWTLIPQVAAVAGLFYLGYTRDSRAFYALAALIALIVIEEAFHVLNPVEVALTSFAQWFADWSGLSLRYARLVLVYALVALIGGGLLLYAHRKGSEDERPIVLIVAMLLVVGGFFGGPVSSFASDGVRPRLLFVEELGESVVFAVLAGYVAGLVVQLGRATGPRLGRP